MRVGSARAGSQGKEVEKRTWTGTSGQRAMDGIMTASGKCKSLGRLDTFQDGARVPSDSGQSCCVKGVPLVDHARGRLGR
jgi:hypothetical protein